MIVEPVLNGLLHLFALASAPLPEDGKVAARGKTLAYLNKHVGLADAEDHVGLYRDLVELHEGESRDALLSAAADVCARLRPLLNGAEKCMAAVRVLELASLSADPAFAEGLADTLGAELGVTRTEAEGILAFVANPGPTGGLPACRRWEAQGGAGFAGALAVMRLPAENLFLVAAVGEEPVWLEGRLLERGEGQLLHPGGILRDRQGNELYHSGLKSWFQEEGAKPPGLSFTGSHVQFRFPKSDDGLHDFSFAEQGGRLVGIMGASGSGKSTLLGILNGTLRPRAGEVRLNGRDIHAANGAGEGVMGFVPQDDLLFEDLTVYENLYYVARMCLAHLSPAELDGKVRAMLAELGQTDAADRKVGSPLQKTISGGQRKRLNIALELIREPTVLFVDEPTSGLSSSDSDTVMSLLKEQAARNRLVFVVIHQPSSKIFRLFDSLWILDLGGWPVFTGSPVEAVAYFRSHGNFPNAMEAICPGCGGVNPEQIFEIMEARTLDNAGRPTRKRSVPPEKWNERYRSYAAGKGRAGEPPPAPESLPPPPASLHRPGRLGQLGVFFRRDLRARMANRPYLLITLLEPLLLGLLTGLVARGSAAGAHPFHDNNNVTIFFFMSTIVAVFLGLSVSAEEICRDGRVLQRERFLHLSWWSYINSKCLYLALVSALQMVLYAVAAFPLVGVPGMLPQASLVLFLCSFCASVLGLNISATFRKAVTIYILIPLLIIPQMLLSGVVIPFDDLLAPDSRRREVPLYADFLPPRWGYEALVVEQCLGNEYTRRIASVDARVRLAEFDLDSRLPELLGAVQAFPLLSEERKAGEFVGKFLVLQGEIPRLEKRLGLACGVRWPFLRPDRLDEAARRRLEDFLDECRQKVFEQRRAAAEERTAILERLEKSLGTDGLEELKLRHTNVSVERQAFDLEDFQPVGQARDGLYQKTLPVYRTPESAWGRAHFLAGRKRLGGTLWPTFAFNAAVILALTVCLYLLLWVRLLPRLSGLLGAFRKRAAR